MHRDSEYHLSKSELKRLINGVSNKRDRALIALFVDTGIRRFEAAAIEARDIDFVEEMLIVRCGKGGRLRLLPLSPRLCTLLRELVSPVPSEPVFRTAQGRALSTRQINRIVARAGKHAGLHNPNPRRKNLTCHLIRHSFARLWKDAGGNIETLARILGHVSVKTTWDLYGTQSIEDVKRHYQKLIGVITNPEGKEHGMDG